jgi:hypothetical protein
MFSSKEADKSLGGTGIPKVIQPSNVIARVYDMKLEVPPYDANALNLVLHLETAPITEAGFEGLPVNKDNPELGHFAGQVARVQSQQYSYSDYTNKEGVTTTKEQAIFRWLWKFAKEIGASEKMVANDVNGTTIEEFVENAKPYLVSMERYIHFCIGGAEYENKSGYTQYRLYVVKPERDRLPYQLSVDGDKPTKLITFDPAVHIKKKKPSEPVGEFTGRDSNADLDL